MGARGTITYVRREELDTGRWDDCLRRAPNGLVYGYAWYLDALCDHWDALVLNEYEAVMPLPWRKKWGIAYLYQPFLAASLGVFGKDITVDLVTAFLQRIPKGFKLWDLSLNFANPVSWPEGYVLSRSNHVLRLNRPYESVRAGYHDNILRALRKAEKEGCTVHKGIAVEDILAISREEYPKFTPVEAGTFERLKSVFDAAGSSAVTYGVYGKEGRLLASCAFLFANGRAWYWLVGNRPEARAFGASSLLLDRFFRDYAGRELLFDFEGSDTLSVAQYYRKFGAVEEKYTTLYVNRLPFPFRLLKPLPPSYRNLLSGSR